MKIIRGITPDFDKYEVAYTLTGTLERFGPQREYNVFEADDEAGTVTVQGVDTEGNPVFTDGDLMVVVKELFSAPLPQRFYDALVAAGFKPKLITLERERLEIRRKQELTA